MRRRSELCVHPSRIEIRRSESFRRDIYGHIATVAEAQHTSEDRDIDIGSRPTELQYSHAIHKSLLNRLSQRAKR